jgi:hypothetical protein
MVHRDRSGSPPSASGDTMDEKFFTALAPEHSPPRYAPDQAHSPTCGALRSASSEEHAMPIQDSRYQIDLAALESPSGGERSIARQEQLARIVRQHPQRDMPRVESVDPDETPKRER